MDSDRVDSTQKKKIIICNAVFGSSQVQSCFGEGLYVFEWSDIWVLRQMAYKSKVAYLVPLFIYKPKLWKTISEQESDIW